MTDPNRHAILVVDDDERICASLATALSHDSADVRTVGSAEQALATLSAHACDIVLAGVRMPAGSCR
jgi:DNA-binding NtrC family response regulator